MKPCQQHPRSSIYSSGGLWTVVYRPLPEREGCVYAQHNESLVLGCHGTSFFLENCGNNSVLIYKKCKIHLVLHFCYVYHIFSHWRKWKHSYSGYIISEKDSAELWDWHIKLVVTSLQVSFLGPLQTSCFTVYFILYVCLASVTVCERSGSLIKLWWNIPKCIVVLYEVYVKILCSA